MAVHDTPEAVKELADKCRQLLTVFCDEWFGRYGRDFIAHYPAYYMPTGLTLSEDEIGSVNPQMAEEFFRYMARLDLDNYNRNSEQGLHTTAMSGAWLNVVYGFAGMRTDADVLSFKPTIPPKWKRFRFRIVHHGATIEIEITPRKATFTLIDGDELTVQVYGRDVKITADGASAALQKLG